MLRRLFIYLLLLSALTSEGIISLPANMANFYFSQGSIIVAPGYEVMEHEQVQGAREAVALARKVCNSGLFVLSLESYSKFVAKAAVEYFYFEEGNTPDNSRISVPAPLLGKADKDIIVKISDSSPPIFIS